MLLADCVVVTAASSGTNLDTSKHSAVKIAKSNGRAEKQLCDPSLSNGQKLKTTAGDLLALLSTDASIGSVGQHVFSYAREAGVP